MNKLLPAILLAALLGAQIVEASHVDVDHHHGTDCLQCQLEGGQAILPAQTHNPYVVAPAGNNSPAVTLAPVSTFYRLSARGPPQLSC